MAEYILDVPREQQDRNGKIRCHPSGRYVNPLDLKPEDVDIRDIAHHLSNICRYTGACPNHYSVAQHSVLVSDALPPELKLAGLLHDAAEYVFNDIASPVKRDPRMQWYRDLEHTAAEMIFRVYGVDPLFLPLTKPADDAIFRQEVAAWWGDGYMPVWSPSTSETIFLGKFHNLTEGAYAK